MRFSNPSPRLSAGLVVAALALAPGCASKKTLDKNVDRLVKAALANDYAAFKDMSRKKLVEKFPKRRFELLSQALHELGAYKERTMKGIEVKAGGLRKGRYSLRFEKGTVRLDLTLFKGKLTAFLFKGADLEKAMRKVAQAKYGQFKVGLFEWRDSKGKPRSGNVFKLGPPLKFGMEVWGLKNAGKTMSMKVDLQVVSGERLILNRPSFVEGPIKLPPDTPPVANVTGTLKVPGPGAYTLLLRITDKVAKRTLVHKQAFRVESAATGGAPRP